MGCWKSVGMSVSVVGAWGGRKQAGALHRAMQNLPAWQLACEIKHDGIAQDIICFRKVLCQCSKAGDVDDFEFRMELLPEFLLLLRSSGCNADDFVHGVTGYIIVEVGD